jgi:Dolichyl-phosphate-mannose-protein mannosyltransferase
MQLEVRSPARPGLRKLLLWLLAVLSVDSLVLFAFAFAHAMTSDQFLTVPLPYLFGLLFVVAVGSLGVGVFYAWTAHPRHRKAVAFAVGITAITLLAHIYIIGLPAVSSQGTFSGGTTAQFHSSETAGGPVLTASSVLTPDALQVTFTASGNDAVSAVSISDGGTELPSSGLQSPVSYASPLEPGSSVTGTWSPTLVSPGSNLTVTYSHLTCYSTSSKAYGCVMDEVFYVPEAMGILSGQHCSTGGSECHMEHPPLVPALMAGAMAVLGQFNVVSWRIVQALMGTFSIPLVFATVWYIAEDKRLAYLSATFFALDVMFFSQSSGGLLDVPPVFFGLLALFAFVARLRFWKFDRYVLAGVFLGLAALSKETAVFMAAALVTYFLFFGEERRKARVWNAVKVGAVVALVFAAGLQAYDSSLAPSVPTFVQHVQYMLSYGSSLTANQLACQPTTGYWCKFSNDPGGPPILPTDWVLYYAPVAYYATSVSVCPNSVNGVCQGGQYSYVQLAYYGTTNMLVTWTVFIWVPLVAYALFRQFRRREPSLEMFGFSQTGSVRPMLPGDLRFAALALVWFLWNYVPYLLLFAYGRVTYPFYIIPAIPALAFGTAYWVTRDWFPRWLVYLFVGMVFVFFLVYFPYKGFLPDWLRAIIAH